MWSKEVAENGIKKKVQDFVFDDFKEGKTYSLMEHYKLHNTIKKIKKYKTKNNVYQIFK